MLKLRYLLAATLFSGGLCGLAQAGVCEREMSKASARYGVPLGILYSVGLTESGKAGKLQPYAMNIAGKTVFPKSLPDALKTFSAHSAKGVKLIDLGCMQINHHYHGERFESVRAMFDPGQNVDYAASFLIRLYREHGSWSMAVARYHAGPNNNPAQKKYICRVIRNLVATGFGAWTAQARAFCAS